MKRVAYTFIKSTSLSLLVLIPTTHAFEHKLGDSTIKWGGYIKADGYADSRQVVADRFTQYLLYPKKISCDSCCKDRNAHGQVNMSLVESNIGFEIIGPKLWEKITPSGALRINFWGVSQDTAYLPRLITAYVALDWEKDFLLFGQYEHPLAASNCLPATISYNYGAPMQAQGLQPQLRYMHRFGNFKLTACALEQVPDSLSNGPDGFSTKYLANSMIPDTALCAEWANDKILLCGVFDVKRLRPRLVNDFDNKVNETITSITAAAGIHYGTDNITVNSKFFYAENGVDQTLLSGYAVATQNNCDDRTYTNLRALSWWLDIGKPCKKVTPGIFLGVGKNIGSRKNLYFDPVDQDYIIYSLDVDAEQIDYMFRVSPRIMYTKLPFQCAAELECTGAAFGYVQCNGKIDHAKLATNVRLLVSLYYLF